MADSIVEEDLTANDVSIQIILRQTDYTYDIAKAQMTLHNNDYQAVIRAYLKQGLPVETAVIKPLSMNQQIYKEIRSFMDDADVKQ